MTGLNLHLRNEISNRKFHPVYQQTRAGPFIPLFDSVTCLSPRDAASLGSSGSSRTSCSAVVLSRAIPHFSSDGAAFAVVFCLA